jgi:hypothetical protein
MVSHSPKVMISSVEVGLASSETVNHRSRFPFVDVGVHLDLTNSATYSVVRVARVERSLA